MYAWKQGSSYRHVCGRYMNTDGAECKHNSVDGPALVGLTLGTLQQLVTLQGGKEKVLDLVQQQLAARQAQPDPAEQEVRQLETRLQQLERESQLIQKNLARADGDEVFRAIKSPFEGVLRQIVDALNTLA